VAANLEDPGGSVNIWNTFVGYFKDGLQAIAEFYSFLGGHRWAAAIITLTLIVRTLLLPLAIKQIRSMREQQRLQPEVARLRQKFRSDRQKMSQEMMALYQREGVNPYAACLPMIAQMPVLFAMYGALNNLEPKGGMPFLGLGDLTDKVGSSIAGWALIVIMTAVSFLSTRQLNVGGNDAQRRIQMLMPLFFVFIFLNYPAALMLYWTTQQVYQYVQQLVMTRDQRVKGWRGLLGITAQDAGKSGGKKGTRPGAKRGGQAPAPREKPQVREPISAPEPAVAMAGGSKGGAFDALASRRDLEEKRQRRRRNKKKRRRR
jgi:YidC/Oxa1 family membrane protein insertase